MKPTIGINYSALRDDRILYPEDLESLDKTFYEEMLPNLNVRQAVSLKTDDPVFAETITYEFVELVGGADKAVYNWGGGSNIALADSNVTKKTQKVISLVYGFTINPQELRAAQGTGRPLENMKARAAAFFIARKENELFWKGDSVVGLKGINNADGISTVTPDTGTWDTATGAQIIGDLRKLIKAINQNDGLRAKVLALNSAERQNLDKFVSDSNPVRTVMEAIKAFDWFPGGVLFTELITDGTIHAFDNSPMVVQLSIPMNAQRLEPSVMTGNNTYQINYEERTGGAVIRYPKGIAKMSSI